MFNNAFVLNLLEEQPDDPTPHRGPPRNRVKSLPCLPERLPTTAVLERDAEMVIRGLRNRQLHHSPSPPPESVVSDEAPSEPTPITPTTPRSPIFSNVFSKLLGRPTAAPVGSKLWQGSEPQPWEVFRAIERKDLIFLMEVRDRAFHVLLKNSGDATPLVHSMRIGETHSDVTIILLGALSKWVNTLPDEEAKLPKTQVLLRALRTNLKLAIDYGLHKQQEDLIASFMQTLIMSEGEGWVSDQTAAIAVSLRLGPEGNPVATAETSIRKFATRELGRAKDIPALEDYVANATADLLMMAAWHRVLTFLPGAEPIPTWYFARDDRVYANFIQKLEENKSTIAQKARPLLQRQFSVLAEVMEGRSKGKKEKVKLLQAELDGGTRV